MWKRVVLNWRLLSGNGNIWKGNAMTNDSVQNRYPPQSVMSENLFNYGALCKVCRWDITKNTNVYLTVIYRFVKPSFHPRPINNSGPLISNYPFTLQSYRPQMQRGEDAFNSLSLSRFFYKSAAPLLLIHASDAFCLVDTGFKSNTAANSFVIPWWESQEIFAAASPPEIKCTTQTGGTTA